MPKGFPNSKSGHPIDRDRMFPNQVRMEAYVHFRRQMEELWDLVKPIKFPAPSRRRRTDRQLPKAA